MTLSRLLAALLATASLTAAAEARVYDAAVERLSATEVFITWHGSDKVDVLQTAGPEGAVAAAVMISDDDADARVLVSVSPGPRPFFVLRDETDGTVIRVAERVLPLEKGSNFRDVGGYVTGDGRSVKWGRIFRAGATPVLTEADLAYVKDQLGLRAMIDLRSVEERRLAPTRLASVGVEVLADDYPANLIFKAPPAPSTPAAPGTPVPPRRSLYRDMPTLLAPQYRALFRQLLIGEGGSVEVNCSAGQDRTGVAAALVLTALGVPRDTIYRDYLLSTAERRPEYELPPFEAKDYPGNIVAEMYEKRRAVPGAMNPRPLFTPEGRILLADAFDEIETKWGSVDAYLEQELAVGPAEIARLKTLYLE